MNENEEFINENLDLISCIKYCRESRKILIPYDVLIKIIFIIKVYNNKCHCFKIFTWLPTSSLQACIHKGRCLRRIINLPWDDSKG